MKKVAMILSDGFEEIEAVTPIALLRRSGLSVDVFALSGDRATGKYDLCAAMLLPLSDCVPSAFDALILPGGPGHAALGRSSDVTQLIHDFHRQNKLLCAICAAPTIFGKLGLLLGLNYTCFPPMNADFGGTFQDEPVVRDGNLITGRAAAASLDFALAILSALEGSAAADRIKQQICYF